MEKAPMHKPELPEKIKDELVARVVQTVSELLHKNWDFDSAYIEACAAHSLTEEEERTLRSRVGSVLKTREIAHRHAGSRPMTPNAANTLLVPKKYRRPDTQMDLFGPGSSLDQYPS